MIYEIFETLKLGERDGGMGLLQLLQIPPRTFLVMSPRTQTDVSLNADSLG
jgi:hypothetical protein